MSNVCKCGKYRDKRTSGPNSKFPGRQYYACDGPGGCGTFDWAASANQLTAAAGPECKCGKASVQRAVTAATNPNKGKKFWACAAGKPPTGCGFFQWQEASHASPRRPPALSPAQPAPQRPALPGYAQHLSDWHQNETLRQMMQCDPALLGSGRDLRQPGNYDTLEVVGSWRIVNKQRKQQYQAALERVGASPVPTEELVRLPDEFASATSRLGGTNTSVILIKEEERNQRKTRSILRTTTRHRGHGARTIRAAQSTQVATCLQGRQSIVRGSVRQIVQTRARGVS